jgi:hypothetical protein
VSIKQHLEHLDATLWDQHEKLFRIKLEAYHANKMELSQIQSGSHLNNLQMQNDYTSIQLQNQTNQMQNAAMLSLGNIAPGVNNNARASNYAMDSMFLAQGGHGRVYRV